MKKEVIDIWFYRMKTLPNRAPEFASSLCSMVCLWLVLIPAIIMAIKGVEFDLRNLFVPSICAIGLATLLFVKWKRAALQIKEQESSLRNYSQASIEIGLGKLSAISSRFQWIGTLVFMFVSGSKNVIIKYIDIHDYSLVVQAFCIFALLFSFALNRLYAYARKRLGEVKKLTEEEAHFLKHEYLGKFLWPHFFWVGCFAVFHWLIG